MPRKLNKKLSDINQKYVLILFACEFCSKTQLTLVPIGLTVPQCLQKQCGIMMSVPQSQIDVLAVLLSFGGLKSLFLLTFNFTDSEL